MADDTATLDAATAPARTKPGLSDQQRASLSSAMSGYQSYVSRLRADSDEIDAKTPTPLKLTPAPPQEVATDPATAFGQPAMFLALFGSLLTRNHLTNAIGAMGAVLKSTHDQDQEIAKANYERWKVESENAVKMAKYQQDAYTAAIRKKGVDANAGRAEIETQMAAMKDEVMQQVYQTEGLPGVRKLLFARGKQTAAMEAGVGQVTQHIDSQMQIAAGFLSTDPMEQAKAARTMGRQFIDIANGKRGTPAERMKALITQTQMDAAAGDLESGDPERIKHGQDVIGAALGSPGILKPPAAPKASSAAAAGLAEDTDRAGLAFKDKFGVPYDPKTATDEQRAAYHDMQDEAVQKRKAGQKPEDKLLPPEALADATKEFRATGKMPALGMGSSPIRAQILAERAKELRDEGGSVADDLGRQADIHSLQQALTILSRSKAAVSNFEGTALKEADLTLQLAKKGVAGGVPVINRWIQAKRQGVEGDPDVSSFNAAMTSFKNEYARIMSSPTATGGQTTDAARNEADSLINGSMNERQVEATIRTMKIGMENRIRSINEEYDATRKRIAEVAGGDGQHAAQHLPADAASQLTEGHVTTFGNGQKWTLENGQPKQVQ